MQCHDTDYAMLPPALRSNLDMPLELCMEEYPKLLQNSVYTTWRAGSPRVEVGLAMSFVSMSCREFDSGRLTLDIADTAAIWYPASRVDNVDDGDESTGEVAEDDNNEDDSDDEDVDEDLHKTATEIATKTYDSSFPSDAEDNAQLEVISGPGTSWMGRVPSYSLKKFIDDMATIALNFIQDATAYETELSASDGMAFTAGLAHIRGWIADLIKEASALELTYGGAQKKFVDIIK